MGKEVLAALKSVRSKLLAQSWHCVRMCVRVCRGQESASDVILRALPPILFVETECLAESRSSLVRQGWQACCWQEPASLHLHRLGLQAHATVGWLSFYAGARDQNQVPVLV